MKKLIFSALFLLSVNLFSQDCEYSINFKENKRFFTLLVETIEAQPSMGNLVITEMTITRPKNEVLGVISLNIDLDDDSLHLPALGPRKGLFKFFKGRDLPQIINGQYEIFINGYLCGHLEIDSNGGGYYPLEKSFQ